MINVKKGGRCWNAAHRDAGTIIHIVNVAEEPNGFFGDKALCGTQPGARGYGWLKVEDEATCQKCLKKLIATEIKKGGGER